MTETWKPRRVWWFTRLQNGRLVWPGTMVEYEQFKITIAPWMIGGVTTVTHYRACSVLNGN